MASGRADERLGEDMVELVSLYGEEPELLRRIRESRRPQGGRGWIQPDKRRGGGGEVERLAPDTLARIRRHTPGRRARMVNAALGSAIFAAMSIAAFAMLEAPYSYIFASGPAALAAIMLAREARGNV